MKLKLGMMGNTEFDQFLVQYARGLTPQKTPATLDSKQFMDALAKYKEYTQDPVTRALLIGTQGLQQQLLKGQVGSILTDEEIKDMGKDLYTGAMAPQQYAEFKTSRVNQFPKLVSAAKAYGQSIGGKPFDLSARESEFQTRKKTEDDFGPGKEGGMIRSNNNAFEHLGLLDEARQALGTNNIPLMRAISQSLGIQFGGSAATTYDLIAQRVGDEITKSFVPGAGGELERLLAKNDFRRELGDTQIKDNIRATFHLLDSQTRNLEAQYERGTFGRGSQKGQFWTPRALEVRSRLLGEEKPAAGGAARPQFKKDDTVMYQGKRHRVLGYDKDGKLILEP